MPKIEIPLEHTDKKVKMETDEKTKTFLVEIPKSTMLQIYHAQEAIDVMAYTKDHYSKGLSIVIPKETEVVKIQIKVLTP